MCLLQFQARSQVSGGSCRGGAPHLAFLQRSLVLGGGCSGRGRVSALKGWTCPLVSLQNSHHTCFCLAQAKSRVLSYRKTLHQGNPRVWPGKLPYPLGQGVQRGAGMGAFSSLTSRFAGQFPSGEWAFFLHSARAGGPSTPGSKTSAFRPGKKKVPNAVWFHFL